MAKSIMQEDVTHCYICGRNGYADRLEWHHVFGGSNRDNSEDFGLVVHICGERCHRNGKESVHRNAKVDRALKAAAQECAMVRYGLTVEQFRKIFRKSYL